jgi:hypothetical protein
LSNYFLVIGGDNLAAINEMAIRATPPTKRAR